MSEYIDRDLALSHPYANGKYDKVHANIAYITGFESYKEWLERLPKADVRENRWIPVSERLPEKEKEGYIDFYKCLVAVSYTSRNDICDSFTAYFDGKHFYEHLYDRAFISGVKAWQPLPEPYQKGGEE